MEAEKQLLSKNIEFYRNRLGMTQQELANRSSIHFATLNAVINDPKRNITLANVAHIAKALGVSLAELFREHGDTEHKYSTRTERFWDNFTTSFEVLFGYPLTKDDRFVREKFEHFYRYCGEPAEMIEEYWRDRSSYGFSSNGRT
jgi:transcriptional regulator with XRE-family HTH domain